MWFSALAIILEKANYSDMLLLMATSQRKGIQI
jgi:hypothetical protein